MADAFFRARAPDAGIESSGERTVCGLTADFVCVGVRKKCVRLEVGKPLGEGPIRARGYLGAIK